MRISGSDDFFIWFGLGSAMVVLEPEAPSAAAVAGEMGAGGAARGSENLSMRGAITEIGGLMARLPPK